MNKKYLTVSALTNYIKHKLDHDPHLQQVHVQGEISDFYLHRFSGHMYITIKDEQAQLKAVMYQGDNRFLKFQPETGMSVYLTGYISIYPKNGEYQLYIKQMEPSGIGALHLAYEQLKEKLHKANYFSEEHKRPIPRFPKKIAIITSRDGAAVQDIITTIQKRYPIVQLVIIPVNVQGIQSAPTIIHAIERANNYDFDTIILARGGGSIEDLASFNDEQVAMAIFNSRIPIISGVGHETDTTISDLIADLRAPTPTGAAQVAVPSLSETIRMIQHLETEITRLTNILFMQKKERITQLEKSTAFTYPMQLIREKSQQIDHLTDQLATKAYEQLYKKERKQMQLVQRLEKQHPQQYVSTSLQKVSILQTKINNKIRETLRTKQHQLAISIEKLSLLNPLHIMKRGYSVVYSDADKVIKSIKQVHERDTVTLALYDGKAICEVKEVKDKADE